MEMIKHRFVGSEATCSVADPQGMNTYGQEVLVPKDHLLDIAHNGLQIVPEDVFEGAAFDPKHLKKYFSTKLHGNAPQDFIEKRNAMWVASEEYRRSIIDAAKKEVAN